MPTLAALVAEAETAARILQKEEALEPAVEELRAALGRIFTRQANGLIRLLEKYRERFDRQEESIAREADIISAGEWVEAWETIERVTRPFIAAAIVKGMGKAMTAGGGVAEVELGLAFDLENPKAQAYIAKTGGELITRMAKTTKDRVRTVLGQSFEGGWSWGKLARELKSRFADMGGRAPQQHIRSRAELIAINELGNAFEEATMQTAEGLASSGIGVEKQWLNSGDDRVSDGCLENTAAGWIALRDTFPSGHLRPLRFPGCRCSTEKRIVP